LRGTLKTLRSSQPFNFVATSVTRAVLQSLGRESETCVRHLHRVGDVTSKLPNGRVLRLRSRGDDWVSNQVFWRGWNGYDPETAPIFFRLAQSAHTIFDVGSYVGYYTLLGAHANPAAQVFAFEPLPAVFRRLERHVALNGLTNVRCTQAAVGETRGEADFYHGDVELPTSSSLSEEFMRSADVVRVSRVPILALDDFIEENQIERLDLMKVDTESTEPQVLRGMMRTLRRDSPVILCEVLKDRGSEAALEEILGGLGYRFYLLTPDGPVAQLHVVGHPEWYNYLFVPAGREGIV